jgi:hypothetical protein
MTEELPLIKAELAKVITESENSNDDELTDREQTFVSQWCRVLDEVRTTLLSCGISNDAQAILQ